VARILKLTFVICRMVEEEMKKFEPTDYIASLPPVPAVSFEEGSHLRAEWDRVAADESSKMQAVDETRYACRPPEGKDAKKEENWLAAIRAANTQLEHTAVRRRVQLRQCDLSHGSPARIYPDRHTGQSMRA
jgi:hypothetical protein